MNKYDVVGSYVTKKKSSEKRWFDEVVEAKSANSAIKTMWKMIEYRVVDEGDEVYWFNRTFAFQKKEVC